MTDCNSNDADIIVSQNAFVLLHDAFSRRQEDFRVNFDDGDHHGVHQFYVKIELTCSAVHLLHGCPLIVGFGDVCSGHLAETGAD